MKRSFPIRPRRTRAGMTLTELMVAVAIASVVSFAVISLQIISGHTIKEVNGQTMTRSSRMRSIDQIRYKLYNARIGSCVVTENDHRLEFEDPNLGGVTSAFFFENETLFYDDDIDDATPARNLVNGPIDITFGLESAGALVRLKVKTSSEMAHADVDVQDGETLIYLRNV